MKTTLCLIGILMFAACNAQKSPRQVGHTAGRIQPAAERLEEYLPLLQGKRVAIFANQTSIVGNVHLVDTLQSLGVKVMRVFAPEHGFRGTADAGEKVDSYKDKATGIDVVSLYGKKRKPSAEDLKDVDIMLFDIQDVGVRFYTFISSLQDYMECAFDNEKPLLILDRPNPNGFYVDGPVLDTAFKSFIGMQPVPVVYGMTIGEYGLMLAGERWLSASANKKYELLKLMDNGTRDRWFLKVIANGNYTHKSKYELPVRPSPNLPYMSSIYWYPSTCFFEGTVLSEGRGTDYPFEIFGHPELPKNLYSFTPTSREGAKNPKLVNQLCYGWNIHDDPSKVLGAIGNRLNLSYLITAYQLYPDKSSFFIAANKKQLQPTDYFFNKLAGNAELMQQIRDGKSEEEIRNSWKPGLNAFKKIRKKYLLYEDF